MCFQFFIPTILDDRSKLWESNFFFGSLSLLYKEKGFVLRLGWLGAGPHTIPIGGLNPPSFGGRISFSDSPLKAKAHTDLT